MSMSLAVLEDGVVVNFPGQTAPTAYYEHPGESQNKSLCGFLEAANSHSVQFSTDPMCSYERHVNQNAPSGAKDTIQLREVCAHDTQVCNVLENMGRDTQVGRIVTQRERRPSEQVGNDLLTVRDFSHLLKTIVRHIACMNNFEIGGDGIRQAAGAAT